MLIKRGEIKKVFYGSNATVVIKRLSQMFSVVQAVLPFKAFVLFAAVVVVCLFLNSVKSSERQKNEQPNECKANEVNSQVLYTYFAKELVPRKRSTCVHINNYKKQLKYSNIHK